MMERDVGIFWIHSRAHVRGTSGEALLPLSSSCSSHSQPSWQQLRGWFKISDKVRSAAPKKEDEMSSGGIALSHF